MAKANRRGGVTPSPVSSSRYPRAVAIISSDWHLADSAFTGSDITGDAYNSFRQIIDMAIDLGLPVIAAGDLFDKRRPPPTAIAVVNRQMERMREHNLAVYFITGQHCRAPESNYRQPIEWLDAASMGWPQHVDRTLFTIGPYTFYGLDWRPPEELRSELAQIPEEATILIAHQIWEELRSGNAIAPEASLVETPSTVTHVYSGDWHVHATRSVMRDDGTVVWGMSPGSIAVQDVVEDPAKYVYILYDNGEVGSSPLKTRPLLSYRINSDDELDEALIKVVDDVRQANIVSRDRDESIRVPIVAVAHASAVGGVKRRFANVLGDTAFLRVRAIPSKRTMLPAGDETPRTSFDDAVAAVSQDPLARQLASQLHHAADPAAALASFKQRYFSDQSTSLA